MGKLASKAIELPHHKHIPVAQGFETGGQTRPIIATAGRAIFIDVVLFDADGAQGIVLQVEGLRAIGFVDTGISEQHVS